MLALPEMLALLERLAPLDLAESWDNVGSLIEPARFVGAGGQGIARVLCTIDLRMAVLAEACAFGADMIVAYHPPIFKGFKRLRAGVPDEAIVLELARREIALYSPHTALDAAPGGVNDWLLAGLGQGERGFVVPSVVRPGAGLGRTLRLHEPTDLATLVQRIKAHLGLRHCRVAASAAHAAGERIERVAVCAGSGGEVLARARDAELFLTGEMRHHDVLAKTSAGASVVLCEHTNTERGYLAELARHLVVSSAGAIEVRVSEQDRDPLDIV